MFSTRVLAEAFGRRLDPEHYAPEAVALDAILQQMPGRCRLGDLVNPERQITNGVRGPELAESEFRLVRLQDCVDWEVDLSRSVTISPGQFAANRRCRLHVGDVVVAIGGYLGNAAVFRKDEPAVIGQHSAVLPFGHCTSNDPRYLVAFLNSRMGEILFRRWSRGTVQAGLNLEDVGEIEVVCPDGQAQRYVGSKVREAEALRDWARSTESRFNRLVNVDVPDATGRGRQSRATSADLDLDLNPGRFTPDRLQVRRALMRSGARLVDSLATISADNVSSPAPGARYLGLDGISTSSVDITLRRFGDADVSGTCRILPSGAAISKLRPYLNKAVLIPRGHGQVVGSTELLCVRSDTVHPGYLYGVLKLDTTVRQLNPVASGATHPRVGADEVLDLLVPWREDHEVLGASLERAQLAYFAARGLVTAARFLVEALIERKVTEPELIDAGKDPAADRAILARLAEDGLDGVGAPLFPDLEGLAALIEEAQRPGGDA